MGFEDLEKKEIAGRNEKKEMVIEIKIEGTSQKISELVISRKWIVVVVLVLAEVLVLSSLRNFEVGSFEDDKDLNGEVGVEFEGEEIDES